MRAIPHPRQAERLAALRAFHILDTARERRFDSIAELAAELCEAPIAVINLIDEHRQWFKAEVGLGVRETPLETSICSHIILQPGLTIIPDTLADTRMQDNPLCASDPHLRFYAGALLQAEDGLPLGTLCVLDYRPRTLNDQQQRILSLLAEQVMTQMRLTRETRLAKNLLTEVDHRVKNSLSLVGALLSLQVRQAVDPALIKALELARDRVTAIANVHDQLHSSGSATEVDLSAFVQRLAKSLASTAPSNLAISVDVPGNMIPAARAVNVGIILNELVTNAIRHGFPDGRAGAISIVGKASDSTVRLAVRDNGVGLRSGFDPSAGSGLGMRLTMSLADQFGSALAWSDDQGSTVFSFEIPLH